MSMNRLINLIKEKNNPTIVGLDPLPAYLPDSMITGPDQTSMGKSIFNFNKELIDAIYDIVPAVKPQMAYYELLGLAGMEAFFNTIKYAKEKGLYVIIDGKRNDIGSTADCYAKAYLDNTKADSITVNGYLGYDGIRPFIREDKSMFVLVKTSNKSSGEVQDNRLENGKRIYEVMGDLIEEWGENSIDENGYSNIGAVVGATYPEQLRYLRERMSKTFFLVPGYGAQGGTAKDIAGGFVNGIGSIINSSRGVMCAYKKQDMPAEKFAEAARIETIRMRDEINSYI